MKNTLAVLLMVGGLIGGCSSTEHPDNKRTEKTTDKTTTDAQDVYSLKGMSDHQGAYQGTPISRGGPREDWNSIQSDPVCDMTINPKNAVTQQYYGGKIYYFDSEHCRQLFLKNPQAYVAGNPEERPVQEAK